jgi:hypothetical protein
MVMFVNIILFFLNITFMMYSSLILRESEANYQQAMMNERQSDKTQKALFQEAKLLNKTAKEIDNMMDIIEGKK